MAVLTSGVRARRVLLALAVPFAGLAIFGGLAKLGFRVAIEPIVVSSHGTLFVFGVFGVLISLERAVAVARPWAYGAPLAFAVGAGARLVHTRAVAEVAFLIGSIWFVALHVPILRRQSASFTWLMTAGAGVWLVSAVAWVNHAPTIGLMATWICFFVLTIIPERLEQSRLRRAPAWASPVLTLLCAVLAIAALAAIALGHEASFRVLGGALVLISLWELRFDIAVQTVRFAGLARFIAIAVLAGVAWLLIAGAMLLAWGLPQIGPGFDAPVHSVFVGFVLSMVFAHALIILPAVARVNVTYHPALYGPLALLHLSLAVRVAGDLAPEPSLRQLGGAGHGVALLAFALTVVLSSLRARRRAGVGTRFD